MWVQGSGLQLCHDPCSLLSSQGIQFSVVVTEGRPDETGLAMARELHELGVPVIAILDSAVAFALERLRCVWPLAHTTSMSVLMMSTMYMCILHIFMWLSCHIIHIPQQKAYTRTCTSYASHLMHQGLDAHVFLEPMARFQSSPRAAGRKGRRGRGAQGAQWRHCCMQEAWMLSRPSPGPCQSLLIASQVDLVLLGAEGRSKNTRMCMSKEAVSPKTSG